MQYEGSIILTGFKFSPLSSKVHAQMHGSASDLNKIISETHLIITLNHTDTIAIMRKFDILNNNSSDNFTSPLYTHTSLKRKKTYFFASQVYDPL